MTMDVKRWPPPNFAELSNRLAARFNTAVVLVGGPGDQPIVDAVQSGLTSPAKTFIGTLSFGEIGALARNALLYVGNDTGLTHYAAASGAKTVMILGPSDPARYAPFTPDSVALWKPTALHGQGVVAGAPPDWDWARDGISVDDAERQIMDFLTQG
jgi:ADP-heptose:LPS heptosyltransferase